MQVVSSINNLIIGKIYVDHGGVMRITSSATGMACKLKFKEQGLLSRHEAHEVGCAGTLLSALCPFLGCNPLSNACQKFSRVWFLRRGLTLLDPCPATSHLLLGMVARRRGAGSLEDVEGEC